MGRYLHSENLASTKCRLVDGAGDPAHFRESGCGSVLLFAVSRLD